MSKTIEEEIRQWFRDETWGSRETVETSIENIADYVRSELRKLGEEMTKRCGNDLTNPENDVIIDAVNNSFNEMRLIISQEVAKACGEEQGDLSGIEYKMERLGPGDAV